MTDSKTSSLPHLLQSYDPNYVPGSTPGSAVRPHQCSGKKSASSRHDQRSRSQDQPRSQGQSPNKRSGYESPYSTRSQLRSGSPGEQRSRKSRKSDAQRYEELSNKWDQAKQEVRNEDHEILREKIVLQQELIRKQDEYAERLRQRQAQADLEKKEAKREKKQATEEQLQQICKQSLEEDKKAQRDEKKAAKAKPRNEVMSSSSGSSSIPSSPVKSPTTPTTPGGRRSNPFKMTLPAVAPTPDIVDSDSESEAEKKESTPIRDLPWHEQQLYRLYGKNADYFLHPKIDTKVQEKKTNPKLRRQGANQIFDDYRTRSDEGRAGAEALWSTLRHDSEQRLLKEDDLIPDSLKEAYGSFARQSLKRNRIPVRRMFCTTDDLPEMPRLLDNTRVQRLRKMRHKTDLMYRASVTNQDRTEVLTFNNPLPEFHERTESIGQYLPSWQDEFSEGSTPPLYTKWIVPKDRVAHEETIQEENEDEAELNEKHPQFTQSPDDDMILILSRRRQPQTKQKYVFLSEKDTRVKGMFAEKYKQERENKDLPQPYKGDAPKSYSALGGMISATPDIPSKSTSTLRYSAPLPHRDGDQRTYTSTWQPLSMHALVEYKKQVSTMGEGDFNLGRTKMWSQIPVV